MKTRRYILLMIIAVGVFSMAARSAFTADDLVGTWKYLISDVPPEYESGLLVFEQKDNKTVGYVEAAEKNEMQGLSVDQGKVTFTTENQNGVFKYSFMQKGDTLTGVIGSQYGDFQIKAVRQAKQ
jgi:lipocalin